MGFPRCYDGGWLVDCDSALCKEKTSDDFSPLVMYL